MKKSFLVGFLLLAAFAAPHVFAQSGGTFVPLTNIPGLTNIQPDTGGLASFFNNLYKYLIGLSAALAVIMITWQGIRISLNQDNVSVVTDSKGKIYNAIFGLVLVLSPVLVFSIINPSILNLSINFQSLDNTSTSPPGGTTPGGGASTTTPSAGPTGCTVTGTVLKTAVCDTQQHAQDFAAACPSGLGSVPFFTTAHKAMCGSQAGPYAFADTSSGVISTILGYSYYQPLVSTPSDPNNGQEVVQFANQCTSDGGTTCFTSYKPPCESSVITLLTTGKQVSCWNIGLSCTNGSTGAGGCSSSPNFSPVQSK